MKKGDLRLRPGLSRLEMLGIVLDELHEGIARADILDDPAQEALVRGLLKITGQNILARCCINYTPQLTGKR